MISGNSRESSECTQSRAFSFVVRFFFPNWIQPDFFSSIQMCNRRLAVVLIPPHSSHRTGIGVGETRYFGAEAGPSVTCKAKRSRAVFCTASSKGVAHVVTHAFTGTMRECIHRKLVGRRVAHALALVCSSAPVKRQ